jgi:hypothetical protein
MNGNGGIKVESRTTLMKINGLIEGGCNNEIRKNVCQSCELIMDGMKDLKMSKVWMVKHKLLYAKYLLHN